MPHKNPDERARYHREYQKKHRERKLEESKRRYAANPKAFRERAAIYREKNRVAIRDYHRQWREANKDRMREWRRNYFAKNRIRMLSENAKYRKQNREKIREKSFGYKLKHLYGLSVQQFHQMWENQHGQCEICGTKFKERRTAQVDHNGDTGNVRGLLCIHCNMGIGALMHDTERLCNAITYLKNYNP